MISACSASEPSHTWIRSGWQSSAISRTQAPSARFLIASVIP